jgi:hypothetical protein
MRTHNGNRILVPGGMTGHYRNPDSIEAVRVLRKPGFIRTPISRRAFLAVSAGALAGGRGFSGWGTYEVEVDVPDAGREIDVRLVPWKKVAARLRSDWGQTP